MSARGGRAAARRTAGEVAFLVTCEHGGRRVPRAYRHLFIGAEAVLATHRGWDPGALPLARDLARRLRCPLRAATVTRLLADLNRSPRHPRLLSEWTRTLPAAERVRLLGRFHAPHRSAVEGDVAERARAGNRTIHLAVHTFTPVLEGEARLADLALLYDPSRVRERALCHAWARALASRLPHLAVRRNSPYRGVSDGLTTWLRKRFAAEAYLGIEIEVSQRLLDGAGRFPPEVGAALAEELRAALGTAADRAG